MGETESVQVTVLLPFYNAGRSLFGAVESILSQDYEHFELLLVNDGSTDESVGIAKVYAQKHKQVSLLDLPHQGLAHALNAGLAVIESPYIARMDADDISTAHRLSAQVAYLEAQPEIGVVSSLVRHISTEEDQAGYERYVGWLNQQLTSEQIRLNRFVESPLAHPSVMFRKTCVDQFGDYDTSEVPEDYELWLRWMEAGVQMAKVEDYLLDWYDRPGRLSRTDAHYADEAFAKVRAKYLAQWLKSVRPGEEIVIWGAGRQSRKRLQYLLAEGIGVEAYIDVRPSYKLVRTPVTNYKEYDYRNRAMIISMVSNRGKREEVKAFLIQQAKVEGQDFILAG